jgi:hypothetical protein
VRTPHHDAGRIIHATVHSHDGQALLV